MKEDVEDDFNETKLLPTDADQSISTAETAACAPVNSEFPSAKDAEITEKDGRWAWVVCGAAFCDLFVVLGMHYTVGVLYAALLDHFKESKAKTGQVLDVKLSGDRVVTCGVDGDICIWDGWTGCCLMVLKGHLDSVTSISLRQTPGLWKKPLDTPPHDLLASGSRDCSVKIWNLKEPSSVAMATCHGHNGPVNCVSFGDNSFLASASEDCSVRIWCISTDNWSCYYILSNLGDWVEQTRLWGADTLLYVTVNGKLALWSIADSQMLSSIRIRASNPSLPRVHGAVLRGQKVLVLTALNGLFAWECKLNDNIVHNFPVIGPCSTGVARGTCLTMHGAIVAVGTSSTGAVYVYHLNGKWENQFTKIHCVLQVNKSAVNAISIDDDGQGPCLAAGGDDGIVKVYRWFPPSV